MDCSQYRHNYATFWNVQAVANQYPPGFQIWYRHQRECAACDAWSKHQYCQLRGITPDHHCCLDMAYAIAHPMEILYQGTNRILDWVASWNEYLIPVSHDGYAATLITHCPWCGSKLSLSKREEWYQTLYHLGYDDPGEQDIPDAFHSDRWWREGYR